MIRCIVFMLLVFDVQDNLIPNFSFEDFRVDHCGLTASTAQFKSDNYFWTSPTVGHPNIYSKTVAQNCWNSIDPQSADQPRTGNRMLMICNLGSNGFRSYVQVKLKEPLLVHKLYTIRIWIRVPSSAVVYSPTLGILTSPKEQFHDTSLNIDSDPTTEFGDWISDGWVKVEADFEVKESSEFITIGNFRSNRDSKLIILDSSKVEKPVSWLYLDDIELFLKR